MKIHKKITITKVVKEAEINSLFLIDEKAWGKRNPFLDKGEVSLFCGTLTSENSDNLFQEGEIVKIIIEKIGDIDDETT